MRNIILQIVLAVAVLCPSFALPSGEDNQLSTVLRKESYFNKYRVGRSLCFGALLGNLLFSPTDDDLPILPLVGLSALTIASEFLLLKHDVMYGLKRVKYNWLIDNVSTRPLEKTHNSIYEGIPYDFDYKEITPEPKLTYLDLTKTFALRCCLPTAASLCCYPFLKVYTPLIATAVFSNGLESCLSKADRQNRKAKKTAILKNEVNRRQSIINENRLIIDKARENAHKKISIIREALGNLASSSNDCDAESLNVLIKYIESKENCTITCRVNENDNSEKDCCFDDKVLMELWSEVKEAVKKDLLSKQSLFFKNIGLLDEEAEKALGKIYYSYVTKYAGTDNPFLNDFDCDARLQILYCNSNSIFSHELKDYRVDAILNLITRKKLSIVFGICALTKNVNQILSDKVKVRLLNLCIEAGNNTSGLNESQLRALEGLYTVFLDESNTEQSRKEKLVKFLNDSQQKSARK